MWREPQARIRIAAILIAAVSALWGSVCAHADSEAGFVGRAVCAGWHAGEAARWQGSHHDLAMQEALELLKRSSGRHPADVDILTALVTISRDAGDRQAAMAYAEQLLRVAPNSAQARALYGSLHGP